MCGKMEREELLKVGVWVYDFDFIKPSLLEAVKDELILYPKDMYSLVTFELMYILHVGVSKELKTCSAGYAGLRAWGSRERALLVEGRF